MVDAVYLPGKPTITSSFGGGGFLTDIVEMRDGTDFRIPRRPFPRRNHTASYDAMTLADAQAVSNFFDGRLGMSKGFLLSDPLENSLTDHLILTATGGETTVQVKKVTGSLSRNLHYVTSLIVKKNGSTQTITTHYTVNSTGLITFVSPLTAADAITVSCSFSKAVRFNTDEFRMQPLAQNAAVVRIADLPMIELIEAF